MALPTGSRRSRGSEGPQGIGLKPVETAMPFHPNKLWMPIAQSQAGVKYGEGFWLWSDNRKIMEYFTATDYPDPTPETWWCAAFVSWVMKKSGRQSGPRSGLYSAAAIDWLTWKGAVPVNTPEPGDIVIIRTVAAEDAEKNHDKKSEKKTKELRKSGYHVGFYISSPSGKVRLLGGNQGKAVCEEDFNLTGNNAHAIKGNRRPKSQGSTALLKIGSAKDGCTLKGYEGCLPLATFTNGLERTTSMETGVAGRGPGVPQFETVSMTRLGDGSAISLFGMALKGSAGVDATISFLSANGRETLKYVYRNAILTDYHMAGAADETATEGIFFSYSRVEVTYTPYDAAGKAGNPVRLAYVTWARRNWRNERLDNERPLITLWLQRF